MRKHVCSVVLAGALAGVALVAGVCVKAGGEPAAVAQVEQAMADNNNRSMVDRFPSALRRSAALSDVLPPSVVQTLRDPDRAGYLGIDPASARVLATFGDQRLLLVRGAGNVCTVQLTSTMQSLSCSSDAALANSNDAMLTTQVAPGGGYRVFGAMEEGAGDAKLLTRSGRVIDATIRGGAFLITVDAVPESLSWTAADGSPQTTALQAPPTH